MQNDTKSSSTNSKIAVEASVRERYGKGAEKVEVALCCPVDYNPKYLEIIPQEIIEKDYGCGDPSNFVQAGDTVLDLGSGGGKICYIAAQIAGASGKIIGVDMNTDMLNLANKYKEEISKKLGYSNVEFRRGKIQDLKLSLDAVDEYISQNPVKNIDDFQKLDEFMDDQRDKKPLIPSDSIDLIVSNCVLNLVKEGEKEKLFQEMYRVLKKGGRAAISDIVADEDIPEHQKNDPYLWSGCISGAFLENQFVQQFEKAGFYGIKVVKRDAKAWQIVEGIEYRSVTIVAYQGKEGPCMERNQAVIYKGPWKSVEDDDGHKLYRGERMAVCDKTFNIYCDNNGPYSEQVYPILPVKDIPLSEATEFDCSRDHFRHARETKGLDYKVNQKGSKCGPGENCC